MGARAPAALRWHSGRNSCAQKSLASLLASRSRFSTRALGPSLCLGATCFFGNVAPQVRGSMPQQSRHRSRQARQSYRYRRHHRPLLAALGAFGPTRLLRNIGAALFTAAAAFVSAENVPAMLSRRADAARVKEEIALADLPELTVKG